jgi:hypothetical protein
VTHLSALTGEYELVTEQPEGCSGPPLRTALRLEAGADTPGLTGSEEYSNAHGRVVRQPVTLNGNIMLIGDPAAEGGPSRYPHH